MTLEEAISFGDVWLVMNEDSEGSDTYEFTKMAVSALSDTGSNIHAHWEPVGKGFQCFRCGTLCAVTEFADRWMWHTDDKFCRGCGAMMDEKGKET